MSKEYTMIRGSGAGEDNIQKLLSDALESSNLSGELVFKIVEHICIDTEPSNRQFYVTFWSTDKTKAYILFMQPMPSKPYSATIALQSAYREDAPDMLNEWSEYKNDKPEVYRKLERFCKNEPSEMTVFSWAILNK